MSSNLSIIRQTFAHARSKIYRADRHVRDLQEIISNVIDDDPCRIVAERDAEGYFGLRVIAAPLPIDIPLCIGDAIHCLNASLDYVASGLLKSVEQATSRDHFPRDEDRKKLRQSFMPARQHPTNAARTLRAGANRKIVENFPAVAMALLCKIKPYRNGGHAVWEIGKADTIDKHRLIIPTVVGATIRRAVLRGADGQKASIGDLSVSINSTTSPFMVSWGGDIEVEYDENPTLQIAFPQSSEVFAGQPVVPTILQCIQLTKEVIAILESEVL